MSRLWKHWQFLPLTGVLLGVFGSAAPAAALDTTFTQKILPLNCIFTTINAGTGELHYVTPEACGVYVQPPAQVGGGGASQAPGAPAAAGSVGRPSLAGGSTGTSNGEPSYPQTSNLPWQPLAAVVNTKQATPHSSTLVRVRGAIVITAATLALVVLAIVAL